MAFQPKTTRARFNESGLTTDAMIGIGESFIDSMFARWDRAENVYDVPAKPLKKGYAIQKSKLRRGNRRNLKLTGDMRAHVKVLSANQNRVVIGPTDSAMAERIRFNNMKDRQYGVSPKDKEAIVKAVLAARTVGRAERVA